MSGQLPPCPGLPCCVCSGDHAGTLHRVDPIAVSGDSAAAFTRLKGLVAGMPRTVIVAASDDYLHAVCRTRLGFVDDLECRLSAEGRAIHVRSASRLGIWDFGVNRRRVESLRRWFQAG